MSVPLNDYEPTMQDEAVDTNKGPDTSEVLAKAKEQEQRLKELKVRKESLSSEIGSARLKLEALNKHLKYPAKETVRDHISLLQEYNEIKDIGQALLGLIAENKDMTIREIYREYGVGMKD